MTKYVASPETFLAVQNFLFEECALIDAWQLDEWLTLYTDDAEYFVPPMDLDDSATPENSLFYIADDRKRLQERVLRLSKKTAHSEYPRSRVRHLVSNVRVLGENNGELKVDAAFVCYRTKDGVTDVFMGRYDYLLRKTDDGLKVRAKRCHLDLDGLRPHGRISIIL
jgi:p-cumate 2,3-dioxygenase beta subunit